MSAMSSPGATGAWSYRTGPWFAAFGPRVTVLLPESQRDQVIGVWSLVDGGAGFDEVLDGLLASGLSRLPGFVLVSTDDGPTRVLLRGTGVSARLSTAVEEVTLDGSAGSTWVERSVEGVTALSVVLTEAATEDDHAETDFPVVTGLVRVARIDRPPHTAPAPAAEQVAAPADVTPDDRGAAEEAAVLGGAAAAATGGAAFGAMVDGGESADEPATADEPAMAEEPVMAAEPVPTEGPAPFEEPRPSEEPVMAAEPAPFDEPAPFEEPSLDEPAMAEQPSPLDGPVRAEEPSPYDEGPATEVMMPLDGDPLTDPMPPEHDAPSDWVTPWGAPPPPPLPSEAAAMAEAQEHPAGADDVATAEEPAVEAGPPEPASYEPVTEVAPPSYSPPPPPPVDLPPVDAPPPPPLPVGSWEPVGGGFPPPPPAPAAPDFPPPAPAAGSDAVAKLLISDGQQVLVDRVILIGRAPEARRFTSTEQPHLVTVPSRLHEISSTHVEVRPGTGSDEGSAVVTDMGSTNGTVLVQPGQGPEDLKPGIAVPLAPGAIINLGDGITIQVTRP